MIGRAILTEKGNFAVQANYPSCEPFVCGTLYTGVYEGAAPQIAIDTRHFWGKEVRNARPHGRLGLWGDHFHVRYHLAWKRLAVMMTIEAAYDQL
jgi:hypothetical protein